MRTSFDVSRDAGRSPNLTAFRRKITRTRQEAQIQVSLWTNELGGSSDQLIYRLAYGQLADRRAEVAARVHDPKKKRIGGQCSGDRERTGRCCAATAHTL